MWNSNLSAQALYEDYMENFYGICADGVKRIVAILENYSKFLRENFDDYFVDCHGNYRHKDLVNENLLNRLLDIYDQTEKKLIDLNPDNFEELFTRLSHIKVTLLHMKAHKVNHELFDYIKKAKITKFSGQCDIHENLGQTLYNVDIRYSAPSDLPTEISKLVKELDVNTISDTINLDL